MVYYNQDNSKISAGKIAENIGLSITAIENNIRKLREAKILERESGRKEGYWKIIPHLPSYQKTKVVIYLN